MALVVFGYALFVVFLGNTSLTVVSGCSTGNSSSSMEEYIIYDCSNYTHTRNAMKRVFLFVCFPEKYFVT